MEADVETIKSQILNAVHAVARSLPPGYLESVYRNALLIELQDRGLSVAREVPLQVSYKGHVVGDFRADIVVENTFILELKAVHALTSVHELQLVNYLHVGNIPYGFLINFGELPVHIKRKDLDYLPLRHQR